MSRSTLTRIVSRARTSRTAPRILVLPLAALFAALPGAVSLQTAVANGETRTIEIYHTHTKESVAITYKRNGTFDRDALEKLNWTLRDWRRDEPTKMDPRLFDIVWEVRKEVGSNEPLNIVSAYRSPETNAMLRHRSRAVAKHSQHMLGKAMDFYLPDVSMSAVREIALRLQRGGVGYYPTAYNPFVHLDAGSVRHWPRMTRDQLTRLFPDGKTVHIPSDGKPMPRYDEAVAEIEANGGSVSAYASAGDDDSGSGFFSNRKGKSFFAAIFGGGEDEEEDLANSRGGKRQAGKGKGPNPTVVASYAPSFNDDGSKLVRDTGAETTLAPARPPKRFEQQVIRPTPEPVAPAEPATEPASAPVEAVQAPPAPAPVLAAAPVPLPVQRPVTLASLQPPPAPQLVWQQGPGATAAAQDAAEVARVPLPLARPPEFGRLVANVPLPLPRPVQVASAVPMVPAPAPALAAVAPPTVSAPQALLASAAPAPRPASLKTAVAPDDDLDGPLTTGTFDKGGLNALFASIATPAPSHSAAVNTTKTRPLPRDVGGAAVKPVATVAMRFGEAPGKALPADHFSGPAVKPLAAAVLRP